MRDDDDDIRLYMPVFWRIIMLVAVIVAVPVVLWTITAFMRTYVAQPRTPTFKPIAAASVMLTPDDTTASIAAPRDDAADADSSGADPKGPYLGNARLASAGPQPAVPPSAANAAVALPAGRVGAAPAPMSPWPDSAPSAAEGEPAPQPVAALEQPTDEDLPPARPIAGHIPLPPHRPHIAAAVTALAVVPLPRARPASAPTAKVLNPEDAPFSRSRQDSM
jgi:hypothetical protein